MQWTFKVAASMAAAGIAMGAQAAEGKPPFTALDTVQIENFVPSPRARVILAPDARHFFVVTARGDVEANVNRATLRVYSVASIERLLATDASAAVPAPVAMVEFASSTARRAIEHPRWEADSRRVTFLAERPGEMPQLHRLDVAGGREVQLTNEPLGVWEYGTNAGAMVFATLESPPASESGPPPRKAPFVVKPHDSLRSLGILPPLRSGDVSRYRVFAVNAQGERHAVDWPSRDFYRPWLRTWLSPDGRWAVGLRPVARFPQHWMAHVTPVWPLKATDDISAVNAFVMQYALIDVRTGAVRLFVDSPESGTTSMFQSSSVAWTPDSKRFFVTSALIPANDARGHSGKELQRAVILEVDAESAKWDLVGFAPPLEESPPPPYSVLALEWDDAAQRLTVPRWLGGERKVQTLVFTKTTEGWKESRATPTETFASVARAGRLELRVKEDVSSPPYLTARDSASGRERRIFGPMEKLLESRSVAAVREYEWRGKDGNVWKGALYTPPDYRPGERRALVVQTHGYIPQFYKVEGSFSTSFAAQALASRGIFVLQMQNKTDIQDQPTEIALYMAGYVGAIDALVAEGWVDPKRVGAIGFSHTCLHVRSMLAFTDRLAAAVLSDGLDGGYMNFLQSFNLNPRSPRYFALYDGKMPFGPGAEVWRERSPTFNIHRVNAPVRLEGIETWRGILGNWEWFAALSMLDKPVELSVIPDDDHELKGPRNRLFSLQNNVDWFDFWLNGREDPDPAKAAQYERWRKLKALRDKPRAVVQ